MKARHVLLFALAAAVTLTSVAEAGPEAAKQRVAINIKNPDDGTFNRDSGTVSLAYNDPTIVIREGQRINIYRNTYTLRGKRGSLSIRERAEFVSVSNEKVPGFDFTPGVGTGTWKVVGGTGAYAEVTGGGRSGMQGQPWLVRQEGFLTRP